MYNRSANIINHIGLVLDASSSMFPHRESLIKVADNQIAHLAKRSKELDQETRISVWVFSHSNQISCVVWDKDVLRLPSIEQYYRPSGQTALIDATLRAINDLKTTSELYGDHSYLLYIFSDGEENDSISRPGTLSLIINGLPDHWTVAALVPNAQALYEAKRFGFSTGNIEVWDTSSKTGVEEVGKRIRDTTDAYMTARASGIRSTTTLFSTGANAVNTKTIKQAGLTPLKKSEYKLFEVEHDCVIQPFVEGMGETFVKGLGYYQLTKRELIQHNKQIAIVSKNLKTVKVYVGSAAREMLGLPDMDVTVKPDQNDKYDVFVQSTSNNRKLIAGTRFIYLGTAAK